MRFSVTVAQAHAMGGDEPPGGRLLETFGIDVKGGGDDEDETTIVSVIVDPRPEGVVIQIDRYESGPFDVVEVDGHERVMLVVSDGPPPDNVRPIR